MGYWTRATVYERAVQLTADIQAAGEQARALDAQTDGSPPDDGGEPWMWKLYAQSLIGPQEDREPQLERWTAAAARIPRGDETDLAWARRVALEIYDGAHAACSLVVPWTTHVGLVGSIAAELRRRLADLEDEAHRLVSGLGDLRRSERRQRR